MGGSDIFVAKWSSLTNSFTWAIRAGGARFDDEAFGVAVNGNSIYVTGGFSSAVADFGPVTLANAAIAGGGADVFVAKLTSAGNVVWAQRAGGLGGGDEGRAIAVNGSSIYVTGRFLSTFANFGTATLSNASTGPPYNFDGFVAKLNDAGSVGTFVWAQSWGGRNGEVANALAISGNNVYVAGSFDGGGSTGALPTYFGAFTLFIQGDYNGFVAKLSDMNTSAEFVWVQQIRNVSCGVAGLAVNGTAVYLTGAFNFGSVFMGSISLRNPALTYTYDAFVARLDDAGTTSSFAWAQRFGGPEDDEALALAVSGPNVYLTGYFMSNSIRLGNNTLTNTSSGFSDVFVAKMTDTGTVEWAVAAGGSSTDRPSGVAVNSPTIYVCGLTYPPARFGLLTLSSFSVSSPAGFLASLTDPTLTATTAAQGSFSFSLAPNPARASTTVTVPTLTGPATLTLLDALGREVRTRPAAPGARTEFDLSGLAPGLYALRATAGAATATQRLVVE